MEHISKTYIQYNNVRQKPAISSSKMNFLTHNYDHREDIYWSIRRHILRCYTMLRPDNPTFDNRISDIHSRYWDKSIHSQSHCIYLNANFATPTRDIVIGIQQSHRVQSAVVNFKSQLTALTICHASMLSSSDNSPHYRKHRRIYQKIISPF